MKPVCSFFGPPCSLTGTLRLWCTGVVSGAVQGSISVTAGNVCDRAGTLQRDYTQQVLEYRVDVNYLTYSLYDLAAKVSVSPCGGGRRRRREVNDVVVSITVSGDYKSVPVTVFLRDSAADVYSFLCGLSSVAFKQLTVDVMEESSDVKLS